ncbi:hypothetical protein MLD38_038658 [Melastoma candidum]|uniref:Uncharacterized protein n=1 Tax=Melastoma candidum TaxID=119954 RepID=A0ACB9L074_9MYRT|nr:hypothetical protein MLD38_038658 [Melastoma candidum]
MSVDVRSAASAISGKRHVKADVEGAREKYAGLVPAKGKEGRLSLRTGRCPLSLLLSPSSASTAPTPPKPISHIPRTPVD